MTRPPRRPTRTRPWAAVRPILFVLAAVLLGVLLLAASLRFAAWHVAEPADAPWRVDITNRMGVPIGPVLVVAHPATRGAHALDQDAIAQIPSADGRGVSLTVHRPCDLRVEVGVGPRVHVFERVGQIGPGHAAYVRLTVAPGPLLDGRRPDSVRSP